MFKKNAAVVGFPFGLISKTDGSAITTGTATGYVVKDGGVQATIAGTITHEGNGQWSVDLTAGEMNGDVVGLIFTHASAIPAHFTIRTTTKIVSELVDAVASPTVGAIRTELSVELGRLDVAVSSRIAPTVANRTLDVSATGEAGIDWGNVGSPTTALNLSATTISTGQTFASGGAPTAADNATAVWGAVARTITGGTIGTYTGNTPQTGDSFARLGVPVGVSIAADIATRSTYAGGDTAGTTTILSRVTGAVALATQIPANFTTATFASAGVFAVAALANAPTGGGGGSAQTGDVFGLLNPLVASGAFTGASLGNVPRTGYALTSAAYEASADAFLDRTAGVETGETPRQFLRKLRAVAMGVSTAAGVFKRKDGTTTSLTVTLDGAGARTGAVDGTN